MSDQVITAVYRSGITVGNDKKVVGDAGYGVVIVVGHYDAMIQATFPYKPLHSLNIHWINLRKRLVKNVERRFAQQDQT